MIWANSILKYSKSNSLLCHSRIVAAILFSALGLPLMAQQSDQKRTPENATAIQRQQAGQSELEKENLNYVAAAPALIKEVLIKDPGLLVELKRWIARETSDNGQVVSEEDLTDNAVFDRLTPIWRFAPLQPGLCSAMATCAQTLIQTPSWEKNKSS